MRMNGTDLDRLLRRAMLVLGLALVLTTTASAQTSQDLALERAYADAGAAAIHGPGTIALADQGTLTLTHEQSFVPRPQAIKLMHAMGNAAGSSFLGLVVPRGGNGSWFITVEFDKIGFASPDVLSALKAKDIYDHLHQGAANGNDERLKLEASRIALGGFIEAPRYDKASHRMIMATRVQQSGPSDDREDSANLDAYIFGRDGVIALTLATGVSIYSTRRQQMDGLVKSITFAPGKRPADWVEATDPKIKYPLEMIFGGQSVEKVEKSLAEAAARKALQERRKQAAIAQAQADQEAWNFWIMVALGGTILTAVAVILLKIAGSDEQAAPSTRATSRWSKPPAVNADHIGRAIRTRRDA
jgi:uncharacterized membrane-anchored protein